MSGEVEALTVVLELERLAVEQLVGGVVVADVDAQDPAPVDEPEGEAVEAARQGGGGRPRGARGAPPPRPPRRGEAAPRPPGPGARRGGGWPGGGGGGGSGVP